MPAGGRSWKLQSVCQFSANSGAVSSRRAPDGDDVVATLDRSDERVVAERTEVQREPFEVVVDERLAGKGQHVVLEPRRPDLGDHVVVERSRQVDTRHGRTARLA